MRSALRFQLSSPWLRISAALVALGLVRPAVAAPRKPALTLAAAGLDGSAIDKSADPCSDFYQYACGSWQAKTAIPDDESKWSRSFSEIRKRNEADLKEILEAAAKQPGDDLVLGQLGRFYGACTKALQRPDNTPTAQRFVAAAAKMSQFASKDELARQIGLSHEAGWPMLFHVSADPDYADATQVILWLDQGGLGLPDRDDYLRDDDKSKKLREFYVGHVHRTLMLSGMAGAEAAAAAQTVLRIETALAQISKTRVERRDPKGLYNRIERKGLMQLGGVPWDLMLPPSLRNQQAIAVTSLAFFQGLGTLWQQTAVADWHIYLRWHLLRQAAPDLAQAWQDEDFAFDQYVSGQPQAKPVWRRCLDETDALLGDLLAQPYVAKRFGGESQARAEEMMTAIVHAFTQRLEQFDWMDPETRRQAAAKAKQMAWMVGRPAVWRSYGWLADDDHLSNVVAGRAAERARNLAKLGKPVDRKEWLMTAPMVNAYYDPSKNVMAFPAGILQAPFFSVGHNLPVNLGAIGMVIGHELTHGFDDEGSQFDAVGNFAQWWKPETRKAFDERTACVARQYDAYEAQPGLRVNGRLTLGENIADIGGLKLAFAAYRALRAQQGPAQVAEGYTEDQQFFLAHAQAWCSKLRPERERLQVQTDPHSPARFRVNGPVANLPEFAAAWHCKAGAPLAPVTRCAVW